METALGASIAVLGTLMGSTLTFLFQRRANAHLSALGIRERARQERLDAYAAFGGAAVRFRVAGLDVWHRRDEGAAEEVQRQVRAEFYRLRTELVDAELRVQLISPHAALHPLMADAIRAAARIPEASDEADRRHRNDTAKDVLTKLVVAAGGELQRDPWVIGDRE
jgi:hypothetical protein